MENSGKKLCSEAGVAESGLLGNDDGRKHLRLDAVKNVCRFLDAKDVFGLALTCMESLEAVRHYFADYGLLSERFVSVVHRYAEVSNSGDTSRLRAFLMTSICEFEELGYVRSSVLRGGQKRGLAWTQNDWTMLADHVLGAAEREYGRSVFFGIAAAADSLYSDPIICTILGHFFLGCMAAGHDNEVVKIAIVALAERAHYFELIRKFYVVDPGSNPDLEFRLRVVGRHLLFMEHAARPLSAARASRKQLRRQVLAVACVRTLVTDNALGRFSEPAAAATGCALVLTLLFGPTSKLGPVADRRWVVLYETAGLLLAEEPRPAERLYARYGSARPLAHPASYRDARTLTVEVCTRPVAWRSQAERVFILAEGTLDDLYELANVLRNRLLHPVAQEDDEMPSTRRILWALTSLPGKEWLPENAAALALLLGRTLAVCYLIDAKEASRSCKNEMTALVLADYKLNGGNTLSVMIMRTASERLEMRRFYGADAWKTIVINVSDVLFSHASCLVKRMRDRKTSKTKHDVQAVHREIDATMDVVLSFTRAVRINVEETVHNVG